MSTNDNKKKDKLKTSHENEAEKPSNPTEKKDTKENTCCPSTSRSTIHRKYQNNT